MRGGKKLIDSPNKIRSVIYKLNRLKPYDRSMEGMTSGYLLGAYAYKGGNEELLFTICSFRKLNYHGAVYKYETKFLDFLNV